MHSIGILPPFIILSSFLLIVIGLFIKNRNIHHIASIFIGGISSVLAVYNLYIIVKWNTPIVYKMGGWPPPLGIVYEVDLLSAFLASLTSILILLIIVYSTWYIEETHRTLYYYSFLLILEGGLIGIYYTGDVFNLFVMIEVAAIASYILVSYYYNKEAIEASLKYGLFGLIAGLIYFLACVIIYASFGTFSMGIIAGISRINVYEIHPQLAYLIWGNIAGSVTLIIALSIWSFTFLAGVFPNHFWLPDAHPAAPSPISAALSGLVVKAGVYCIIRYLYTLFGIYDEGSLYVVYSTLIKTLLPAIGVISMLLGSLLMLAQRDVKRLVAYSTIVHVSLIFTGISIGSFLGIKGSLYHILVHSIAKTNLFLSVGVIVKLSKTRDLSQLPPLCKKDPVLASSIIVSTLSLIGIPPLAGFFSKLMLYQAFLTQNLYWLVASLLLSSGISLLGYFKLISTSFFGPERGESKIQKASPLFPLRVKIVLLLLTITLVILNPLIINKGLELIATSIIQSNDYIYSALDYYISFLYNFNLSMGEI